MSTLVEAFIAAFDSNTELTWITEGPAQVVARFHLPGVGARIDTTFTETRANEWRVGFEVAPDPSGTASIHSSIRIFSGVFQAVREFLEIRQPERLVFASKEETLWQLYEEYLKRQSSPLRDLGYRMIAPVRISPLAEFTIEKTTPSAWKDR
jgi:hypothetical protein